MPGQQNSQQTHTLLASTKKTFTLTYREAKYGVNHIVTVLSIIRVQQPKVKHEEYYGHYIIAHFPSLPINQRQ